VVAAEDSTVVVDTAEHILVEDIPVVEDIRYTLVEDTEAGFDFDSNSF